MLILAEILYIVGLSYVSHCMLHLNLIILISLLAFNLFLNLIFIIIRRVWIYKFSLWILMLIIFLLTLELSFFQVSHIKFKAQLINGHLVFKQSLNDIHKWYVFLMNIIIVVLVLKNSLLWYKIWWIYFIFKDNLVFIFKFIKIIQ